MYDIKYMLYIYTNFIYINSLKLSVKLNSAFCIITFPDWFLQNKEAGQCLQRVSGR